MGSIACEGGGAPSEGGPLEAVACVREPESASAVLAAPVVEEHARHFPAASITMPPNSELSTTSFRCDASYVQYCFKEGNSFPKRVAGSRPVVALKMPWFKDYHDTEESCEEARSDQYRAWVLGNMEVRGCYVLEPCCPTSTRIHRALEDIRSDFDDWRLKYLDTGVRDEADIAEGMNLCPLYDDNVEAARVQEFIVSVEQHLEAARSPSSSSSSALCWSVAAAPLKREAMFISYRTRGIGSGESYLNHWHTDFDAYVAEKDTCNRGEEVLEEFLVKHLPFISLQLCKKFEAQRIAVDGFPDDAECRRMRRLPVGHIDKEALLVSDLAKILRDYNQDVNNIWFTLRTQKKPCSGLCLQTSQILVDEDHDYRVMDEYVEDEVPELLDSDMITVVNDIGGEVAVVFGSMRYTHRSCKFTYPDDSVETQRRNNMEARFLLLNDGGLRAIAKWVSQVKHHYL